MIIQIIGLPGSGKTYLIKKYLEENRDKEITYIDIADPKFAIGDIEGNVCPTCGQKPTISKAGLFKASVLEAKKASQDVIAESACGVFISNSEVVLLECDTLKRREQYKRREGKEVDESYENNLKQAMMPSIYTVTSEQALFDILDTLFNKR